LHDVKVFGSPGRGFPIGIGEAFESVIKMFPGEFERPWYDEVYDTNISEKKCIRQ
jgi:hypothetical protein